MDKNKHLISKYLEGELDPLSHARFEEDLENDPVLRTEIKLYRDVDKALADTEVMNLRSQLKAMHEEMIPEFEKASLRSSRRMVRIAAAACFIVLMSVGTLGIFKLSTGNQRLLNRFYEPYELTMINRSADSEIDFMMHQAMMHYENKEYKEAVMLFEKLLDRDPSQMATRLYSGISYFEIREFRKASTSFNKIIEHNDNLYIEQAEWYMGFCMIMLDEKEKAVKQFEKIIHDNGFYSDKAKQVIKQLK